MYSKKRIGPSTDPCGTPHVIKAGAEVEELVRTCTDVQYAVFLHVIGESARSVYKGFRFASIDARKDVAAIRQAFADYCMPKKNEVYERYQFNQLVPAAAESIDSFVATLRQHVQTCEYDTQAEKMIRDRIVLTYGDSRVREKLISTDDLTLEKAINICRAAEATRDRMQSMGDSKTPNPHLPSTPFVATKCRVVIVITRSRALPPKTTATAAATADNVTSPNAVRRLAKSAATADAVGILPSVADSQTVASGVRLAVRRSRQPALSTRSKTASRRSTLGSCCRLAVCRRNLLFFVTSSTTHRSA